MLHLRCAAQNYEWGRQAAESEVAQLARANGSDVDEAKPFAELWMGAHPNCPSTLQATGEGLQAFLERHPQVLGATVQAHFGTQLPFLFKVLSVAKALSIQSHPDKELARRLHAQSPKLYPDPNHKPEMALALSDFSALCGFVTTPQLASRLTAVPELWELVGAAAAREVVAAAAAEEAAAASGQTQWAEDGRGKEALRAAFTALMTAAPADVAAAVGRLVARLRGKQLQGQQGGAADAAGPLDEHEALALRLDEQFPGGDVGVMSAFFLNLVRLLPGHAIYLPANEPHAYLSGELVEVMAASDNVIRAGLTPKFKDADVLVASLTYRQGLPDVLTGDPTDTPGVTAYRPPFDEFEVVRVACGGEGAEGAQASGSGRGAGPALLALGASEGPRLVLVQHGCGRLVAGALPGGLRGVQGLECGVGVRRGSVVLVPAGVDVRVEEAQGLVAWAAAVNEGFFARCRAQQQEAPEQAAGVGVGAEGGVVAPEVVVDVGARVVVVEAGRVPAVSVGASGVMVGAAAS